MDYDDLNAFLAEDEKRLAEQEEQWNRQKEKLREGRAEAGAEIVSVHADTVAWTADSVKKKLEEELQKTRRDLEYVDIERERDRTDIYYRVLFFLGGLAVFPVLWLIFGGNGNAFNIIMSLIFMFTAAFCIIWTGRELLNSATKFCARDWTKQKKRIVNGLQVLTYAREKELIEEQILRINKFLKEVDELSRRSENHGGLSDTDFERLQVLRYPQRELIKGYIKDFTFWAFMRGLFHI